MRFLACLGLAFFAWIGAQTQIPGTPAGTALAAWLEAFNSGDRTRVGAYLGIGLHVVPRPSDQPAVARLSFDQAIKAGTCT